MRSVLAVLFLAALVRAETLEEDVRAYLAAAAGDKPWAVTGAFGVTFTDGNTNTTTLTAQIDAVRQWPDWKLTLRQFSLFQESESVETANEHIFTERLERALSEKDSLFQDLLLEHDEQEELDYRVQFTLGYKRRLVKKEHYELHVEVGGGVLHEEFRVNPETEGIAQVGYEVTWNITDDLTFTQATRIYPSLSEGGEFRLVSETVFSTPVGDRLDLRLSIIDKYDSAAPAGVENNDLAITLTLAIKFTGPK